MAPLEELTAAYLSASDDPSFQSELATLLRDYGLDASEVDESVAWMDAALELVR